jgi:hypothetical protein
LILKKSSTKTNGKVYHYKKWNICHHKNRKWCYLNKDHLNQPEIKSAIEAAQTLAQNKVLVAQSQNNGFSRVFKENTGFFLEPGMGFEPICSESAAHRLNLSATPAYNGLDLARRLKPLGSASFIMFSLKFSKKVRERYIFTIWA